MQRIIYISTARAILAPAELESILRASRRNNAAVGVSGLLIVGGRRFLQALEGPPDAVATVFKRIEADPRHFAVVTLNRKTIEQRAFGDWSMGYAVGPRTRPDGDLRDIVARLVTPLGDATMRAYFTEFASLHAAA